jgi:hypothetical protein
MTSPMFRASARFSLFTLLALQAQALEWKFAYGIHDFVVPEVDSHTLGINTHIGTSYQGKSGLVFDFSLDLFLDHDVDDLDPDHIPVWWMSGIHTGNKFAQPSPGTTLSWEVDLFGMRNTVSCIEKQYKVFPGVRADFGAGAARLSLLAAAGYYFMEIDDDTPRTRGYDRGDFDHGEPAVSLMAETTLPLGKNCQLIAGYQIWAESSAWLQQQGRLSLGFPMNVNSELVIGVEYNQYNLSVYDKEPTTSPTYQSILPWDADMLVRVSYRKNW